MSYKKSLVLEGGAMRDLFTAGVLDVLYKNDIKFDQAVGVSAGAAFGVNYKSHQPGRVLRYNQNYGLRDDFASWKNWRATGDLYNVDMCYRLIPDVLDLFDYDTFATDPMDFWVCATDIENGKPTFHRLDSGRGIDLEWIHASSSIPFFARPVNIKGRFYWDGGVSDSIPIDFFPRFGETKQVVITTQPRDYRKDPKKSQRLYKHVFEKSFPAVYERLKTRAVDYNKVMEEMARQERDGEMLIIAPPKPVEVKTVKNPPEVLQVAYDMGIAEGKKNLDRVRRFFD